MNLPELGHRTRLLIAVIAVVSVIGTVAILVSGTVSVSDLFRTLRNANPRVMGFLALPFIVVVVLIARFFIRKHEDRMWKNAIIKTRAEKQE